MSLHFYQATQCHIPEDSNFRVTAMKTSYLTILSSTDAISLPFKFPTKILGLSLFYLPNLRYMFCQLQRA